MEVKKLVEFFSFWVANTVGLLILYFVFKGNVVLGNDKVSVSMAALLTGFVFTVLGAFVDPLVRKSGLIESIKSTIKASGLKLKEDAVWGLIYLAANIVIVWVLKRFALTIGLGISNILFTLVVAVGLTAAQWIAAMATGATGEHKK